MRGDNLVLPGIEKGQVGRANGQENTPYTDIWVYKSGKRPKSISLEKMLYLQRGECVCCTRSDAVTLSRTLAPHH